MRARINPEQQIQRINHLKNVLEGYHSIAEQDLNRRPNKKAWSILEVMKHISMAHKAYQANIIAAFDKSSKQSQVVDQLKCSPISSYLIKRFPPIQGEIRFKMKTLKKFQPIFPEQGVASSEVIQELNASLDELKSWINQYRNTPISLKKFNSAIGPMVRFNIPEACEFILCHNERHFYQIDKALTIVKSD